MKMNRSILIAAIVLSNIASNAFAVLRLPYPGKFYPPDRIITIGDMNNFKPKTQTQNPQKAMPLTNAVKELYRLAMREGHATRDFSAIYDYLTSSHDVTTIDQRSPAPAKAQLH
jgi:hypothetical protein